MGGPGRLPWRIALCVLLALAVSACIDRHGVTPLMTAAKEGDTAALQRLLEGGADPNTQSDYGWTALMFAAMNGHDAAVEALLDAGAIAALESRRIAVATTAPTPATTALREALRGGHVSTARLLLSRGAPPDAEATALAAGLPDLEPLQQLHALGGPIDVYLGALYTPSALHVAALEGRLENVEWLLDQGVDPSLGGEAGSPLMSAVGGDHPEVVRLLIERGADPDRVSPRTGLTPLLHAATKHPQRDRDARNLEVIRVLLEAGADPGYRSEGPQYRGRTAVEVLRDERDRALVRIEEKPYGEPQARAEQRVVDHRDEIIRLLEGGSVG